MNALTGISTMSSLSSSSSSSLSSIQGIIFDLDGTLLDTETLSDYAMFAALNISPKEAELLVPAEEVVDHPNNTINRTINSDASSHHNSDGMNQNSYTRRLPWELKRQILGLRSNDWGPIVLQYATNIWNISKEKLPSTIDALAISWEEHLNNYCCNVQACIGAYEIVEKLATMNIPMAIATSSYQSAVIKKRQNHSKLFQYFPIIICGDHPNVIHGKPAPDIYIEAAKQMNVNIENCIIFEDAKNGILAAKAANCKHIVAIPDSRYNNSTKDTTYNEMEWFHSNAHVVLPTLLHFQWPS